MTGGIEKNLCRESNSNCVFVPDAVKQKVLIKNVKTIKYVEQAPQNQTRKYSWSAIIFNKPNCALDNTCLEKNTTTRTFWIKSNYGCIGGAAGRDGCHKMEMKPGFPAMGFACNIKGINKRCSDEEEFLTKFWSFKYISSIKCIYDTAGNAGTVCKQYNYKPARPQCGGTNAAGTHGFGAKCEDQILIDYERMSFSDTTEPIFHLTVSGGQDPITNETIWVDIDL